MRKICKIETDAPLPQTLRKNREARNTAGGFLPETTEQRRKPGRPAADKI